jgi:hypothetical protein
MSPSQQEQFTVIKISQKYHGSDQRSISISESAANE